MYLFLLYTARPLPPINFCVISFLRLLPHLSCAIEWCASNFWRYLFTDTTCPCPLFLETKLCFYQESRLRPFFVLSIAILSIHTSPSLALVRPFRLVGGRGGRRPSFPLFLRGDLIQISGFGFVCSVSSYRIDVFFLPLSATQRPTALILPRFLYLSFAAYPTEINCALAHAACLSLSLWCPNPAHPRVLVGGSPLPSVTLPIDIKETPPSI